MTQERLRELLLERVADETAPDLSSGAWQRARVVRRRRRLGAAASVVAATVAVSGGVAVLGSRSPTPPANTELPPPAAVNRPDATYHDLPVWWSPDQREEHDLPAVDSPLPAEIDLDVSAPPPPLDRAVAVFAQGRSMVLVGPAGERGRVSTRPVGRVTKPNGYSYFPPPGLTADGRVVVFKQDDGFVIYDVAAGDWRPANDVTLPTAPVPWHDPEPDTGGAEPYGPVIDGARSYGMGADIPVRDPAHELTQPEFMLVNGRVLVFTWLTGGQDSRYKNCCAVAGWLDPGTVVYESRQVDGLLVSWAVGTHAFGLVSRIRGSYDAASYAF